MLRDGLMKVEGKGRIAVRTMTKPSNPPAPLWQGGLGVLSYPAHQHCHAGEGFIYQRRIVAEEWDTGFTGLATNYDNLTLRAQAARRFQREPSCWPWLLLSKSLWVRLRTWPGLPGHSRSWKASPA